jgi:hypothetical protein
VPAGNTSMQKLEMSLLIDRFPVGKLDLKKLTVMLLYQKKFEDSHEKGMLKFVERVCCSY